MVIPSQEKLSISIKDGCARVKYDYSSLFYRQLHSSDKKRNIKDHLYYDYGEKMRSRHHRHSNIIP